MTDFDVAAPVDHDDHDDQPTPVVVDKRDRKNKGETRRAIFRFLARVPIFLYLLIIYIIVKQSVGSMRNILIDFHNYQITWVEIMYILAGLISLGEIYKISEPGVRNTTAAALIVATSAVYLVLFTLGAAQVIWMVKMFNNTEFLVLTIFALGGGAMALIINPRTAQRAIMSGHDHGD